MINQSTSITHQQKTDKQWEQIKTISDISKREKHGEKVSSPSKYQNDTIQLPQPENKTHTLLLLTSLTIGQSRKHFILCIYPKCHISLFLPCTPSVCSLPEYLFLTNRTLTLQCHVQHACLLIFLSACILFFLYFAPKRHKHILI